MRRLSAASLPGLLEATPGPDLPVHRIIFSHKEFPGLCVVAGLYIIDMMCRLAINANKDRLESSFNESGGTIATSLGSSFFYAYAACQIPFGLLIDKIGPRKLLSAAALLGGASTGLFAISHSLLIATACRVVAGCCAGSAWVGCCKVTARFPPSTHSVLMGTLVCLGFMGGLLAQSPLEALCSWLGWRGGFLAVGGVWFALGLSALCLIREVPASPSEAPPALGASLLAVVRRKEIWLLALFGCGVDPTLEAFGGLWGVSYLKQVQGWSDMAATLGTSLVVVAAGVATSGAGVMSERAVVQVRVMRVASALGVAATVVFTFAGHLPVALLLLLLLLMGVSQAALAAQWTLASYSTTPELQGVLSGFINMTVIFFDAAVGQLIGAILDAQWEHEKGDDDEYIYPTSAYQTAFIIMPASFAGSFVAANMLRPYATYLDEEGSAHLLNPAKEAAPKVTKDDGERDVVEVVYSQSGEGASRDKPAEQAQLVPSSSAEAGTIK